MRPITPTNRRRGLEVIRLMDKHHFTFPKAVRQMMTNEHITHEQDVQRVMRELGSVVPRLQAEREDERDTWAMIETERREQKAAETTAGYTIDPDTDKDETAAA